MCMTSRGALVLEKQVSDNKRSFKEPGLFLGEHIGGGGGCPGQGQCEVLEGFFGGVLEGSQRVDVYVSILDVWVLHSLLCILNTCI